MSSQTRDFATFANDASVSGDVWTNPSDAASANNVYATVSLFDGGDGSGKQSRYLKCTNPSSAYSIPAGAIILGIEFIAECKSSVSNKIFDNIVKPVKGGSIQGSNLGDSSYWATSDTEKTYGGPSNLLGLSWVDTDFGSNFGCVISAKLTIGSATASIDKVYSRVTYIVVQEMAEAQQLLDALTKQTGKAFGEAVTLTDVMNILVKIADANNITVSDAIVAVKLIKQELSEVLSIDDMISLIQGKLLNEGISITDIASLYVQIAKSEGISLFEAFSAIAQIVKTESVSILDVLQRAIALQSINEGVQINDLVTSYSFRRNVVLPSYRPQALIEIFLSETHRFSTEDLYINE